MLKALNIKKKNNRIENASNFVKKTKINLFLKGNTTIICSVDGRISINKNTSPFLATGGSGDVLAGIIGGLILHHKDPFKAAKIGCYIHSNCALKLGPGLIASDLIKMIPEVIKEIK